MFLIVSRDGRSARGRASAGSLAEFEDVAESHPESLTVDFEGSGLFGFTVYLTATDSWGETYIRELCGL